ncbi:hypothetical protein WG66_002222 [Moniliophthora roreri]|nr:hypothetical protein WG66_002222 [Moniliophthora roreri]
MDHLSPTAASDTTYRRGSTTPSSQNDHLGIPSTPTHVESRRSNPGSAYLSGAGSRTSSTTSFSARDSTHLIPSISDSHAKGFHPLALRLPIAIGTPILMLALGIGLEVAMFISKRDNGFAVPKENAISLVSAQFLLAFVPTVLIIPVAFLWRELDWYVRQYQPYILLSRGGATVEETLTNDYRLFRVLGAIINSLRFKHRIVFWSAFTAAATYTLQPLGSTVTSLRSIGLAPDIGELNAFVAAAGFADAAVFNNLEDPPFVKGGWATAEFTFPTDQFLNGTMVVNTTGIQTKANCEGPKETPLVGPNPTAQANRTITSISNGGCNVTVSFDPTVATQQYGVSDASCSDAEKSANITFRPVMFWFFHMKDGGGEEARTVFCKPTITPFNVKAAASLSDGSLINVTESVGNSEYSKPNNVTGAPLNGLAFNGLLFEDNTNPFIQARSIAVKSGVPGAIFRAAAQRAGGLQGTFDEPNAFLDLTNKTYTQHLSLSAKSIYFLSQNDTIPAQMNSLLPRLVLNPIPGHVLALIMFMIGCIGIFLHIIHRRQRKGLFLASPPGTIAATMSITSHSGFGQLLMPYDKEEILRDKLSGLRFRLDRRTGALVADDAPVSFGTMKQNRDEAMMSLLGGHEKSEVGNSSSRAASEAASGYPPWQPHYKTPYDP